MENEVTQEQARQEEMWAKLRELHAGDLQKILDTLERIEARLDDLSKPKVLQ